MKNIKSAWVKEQKVAVENGDVVEYRVTMKVTFLLNDLTGPGPVPGRVPGTGARRVAAASPAARRSAARTMRSGGRVVRPGVAEFVALLALLTSLTALSIDALLPALRPIGEALGVVDARNLQLVVSIFIGGMVVGEVVAGPISDAIGRRSTIALGLSIYALGTLVAMRAGAIETVLVGRFVQGIGVAGSKIASRAMIRDRYAGDEMARIASFVFTVFIVVPMLAPFVGQLVLAVAGWRAIFGSYLAVAVLCVVWLWTRQPETLPAERRLPLDARRLGRNLSRILRHRRVMAYTLAAGCVFGGPPPLAERRAGAARRRLRGARALSGLLRGAGGERGAGRPAQRTDRPAVRRVPRRRRRARPDGRLGRRPCCCSISRPRTGRRSRCSWAAGWPCSPASACCSAT